MNTSLQILASGPPIYNNLLKQEPTTTLRPRFPFQITLPVQSTHDKLKHFGSGAPLQIILTGQKPITNIVLQNSHQVAQPDATIQNQESISGPKLPFQMVLAGQSTPMSFSNSGPNLPSQITLPNQNIIDPNSNSGSQLPFKIMLPGQNTQSPIAGSSSKLPFQITLPRPFTNVAPRQQVSMTAENLAKSTANVRPRLPLIILLPNKALSNIRSSLPPPLSLLANTKPHASVVSVQNTNIGSTVIEPSTKGQSLPDRSGVLSTMLLDNCDKYVAKTDPSRKLNNLPSSSSSSKVNETVSVIKKRLKANVTYPMNPKRYTLVTQNDKKLFKAHNETTCFVCNINFIENDMLLEHLKETSFFCRVCVKDFNSHADLSAHFTTHQGNKCTTCNELFFCRKDRLHHFRTNELCNRGWHTIKCDICEKSLSSTKLLRLHKRNKHGTGKKRYQCIVCKDEFNEYNRFVVHSQNVHNAYEYMSCKLCKRFYLGPGKLKNHMMNSHLKVYKMRKGQFTCPTCGINYAKESSLVHHLQVHQQEQTDSLCEHCGETVPGGKVKMTRHINNKHPDLRLQSYTCRVCLEVFDSSKDLRKHRVDRHPCKQEPKCCEICGKQFKLLCHLKKHYHTHSDERNFKCDVCGATFKQSCTLYLHARTHSNVFKFACDTCGESFRWKQTFDKHVAKCKGRQNQSGDSDSDE